MRTLISSLLLAAAFLSVAPAALSLWLDREVFDRDGFISISQEVLDQPEIQTELASLISGRAVELADLPASSAPLVEQAALSLIPSIAESSLGEEALGDLHDSFLSIARNDSDLVRNQDDTLVLDLSFIIDSVLSSLGPLLGGLTIDETALNEAGKVVIARESEASTLFRAAGWLDRWLPVIVILPLAGFGLALLVSSSRFATLFQVGVALLLVNTLLYLLAGIWLREVLVETIVLEPGVKDAGLAGYDAVVEGFQRQELALMISGGVIAAAGAVLGILINLFLKRREDGAAAL